MARTDHINTIPAFTPIGDISSETPTVATTLTHPADSVGGGQETMVALQTAGQGIWVTIDGTAPVVGTTGFEIFVGERVAVPVDRNTVVKILESASAATVQVQWGR